MRTALALLLALVPIGAAAQNVCADVAETRRQLAEKYGEQRAFHGLSASGAMVEVWVNPDTGSYTAIRVLPNGKACLVDAGEAGTTVALALGRPS
jgi:hypothetical protein